MKYLNIPGLHALMDMTHLKFTMLIAVPVATLETLLHKYIFSDWEFVKYLVLFMTIDTVTGIWKSLKLHKFSSYSMGGIFVKTILYAMFLMVVNGLSNFSQNPITISIFEWVNQLCCAALFVREAVSIVENMGVISPGLLPTWILKRLKQFDENGKFIEEEK